MDAQSIGCSTCPFCPFFDLNSDFVLQHVQYCHPENESQLEQTKSSPRDLFRTDFESEPMRFSGHAGGSNGKLPDSLYHADNMPNLEESTIAQYTHSPQPHANSEDVKSKSTCLYTSQNDQTGPSSRSNSRKKVNRSIKRLDVGYYLSLLLPSVCIIIINNNYYYILTKPRTAFRARTLCA